MSVEDSFEVVMQVAPMSVTEKARAIPEEILEMPTVVLEKKFNLTDRLILKRLRTTFWMELDRAHANGAKFLLKSVYEGFCERQYFTKKVLGNSYALAYMLRRHGGYEAILEEMLIHGLEVQREILDLPIVDEEGRIDMKVLDIKNKIIESTHNRLKGTPVNRTQIHQTTQSLPSDAVKKYQGLEESDIKARIRELEGK
jgi:hypothetical protein